MNPSIIKLLSSGVSIQRSAILLGINRKTVERKLPFLVERYRLLHNRKMQKLRGRVFNIQLDDLITKENSKLKTLSISIAVDDDRRLILAAEVSRIPAFGHLAKLGVKKNSPRKNEHYDGPTVFFFRRFNRRYHRKFRLNPTSTNAILGLFQLTFRKRSI